MRKLLTALLLLLVPCWSVPVAHAQQGDMAYFDSFEGLQRVIARSWAAPMVVPQPDVPSSPAASPAATPLATPQAETRIEALSIFVYLFDSDTNAAAGFARIDADLQKTVLRDPRAPMTTDLPLDDVGNQARGYMGDMTHNGMVTTYTFATIQDGPFVYSLSGMFSGSDSAALTQAYAETLVAVPMDRMAEQFDQAGGSRGGLWSKLNGIEPDLPAGSNVVDFVVYPMAEEMPGATPAS